MSREYYKYYNHTFEKVLEPDEEIEEKKPGNPISQILNFENEEIIIGLILFFLLMEEEKDFLMIAILALLFLNK